MQPKIAFKWTDRGITTVGDLKLRVRLGTTQAFENTLTNVRLRDVKEADSIMRALLALREPIKALDEGADQTTPAIVHFEFERGAFRAVVVFGIKRESNRRGVWAFVICREDELEQVLWKVYGIVRS
jgi:hypothetical protein